MSLTTHIEACREWLAVAEKSGSPYALLYAAVEASHGYAVDCRRLAERSPTPESRKRAADAWRAYRKVDALFNGESGS